VTELLVSIVVPTFDRAGYIETAILSLLEQDYSALEVIVVDDGSQDETRAVLSRISERFPGERFRWISHPNQGQAASINRGFDAARGELLGYLSSDDFLAPGAITSLVRASRHHPEADVLYPSYQIVDEFDAVRNTIHPLQHTLRDAVRWSLCMPGLAALVRRSFFERNGGWDTQRRFIPDFEWWLRDPTATFVRVPQVAGGWRFHSGSITAGDWSIENVRARMEERLSLLDQVFAREDLTGELAEVKREAYSSALIEMGLLCDAGATDDRRRRYIVEDTVGRLFSTEDGRTVEHNYRWSERLRARAEHRAEAMESANTSLHATVGALQAAAVERAAVNELLRRELERVRSEQARSGPPGSRSACLRIARALTPSPWRARLGAAWYRLRTMGRR
jgi:glycosyltransferase involved in cell wall biosynthesis